MAQKDNYVANVVNEEKVSQTPSVLVGKAPQEPVKTILVGEIIDNNLERDEIKGKIYGPLSPNPAHSGFDKQFFVDSLPEYPDQEDLNALFIITQFKDNKVIGYEQWAFDVDTNKWRKVYGSDPNLKITKAPAKQAPQGANPPKQAFAQIFNGNVAINNGKLYINGKEAGQGGGGGSSEDSPKIYQVEDPEDIPSEIIDQLKVGDIVTFANPETNEGEVSAVVCKDSPEENLIEIKAFIDYANVYVYWYALNNDEWELDDKAYYRIPQIIYSGDIDDLDSDFVSELDTDKIVSDGNGKLWFLAFDDEDSGTFLYNIGVEKITYVHYAWDEDEGVYTFDTSYGVDGYNVISLGGGGSSGGGTQLYAHYVYLYSGWDDTDRPNPGEWSFNDQSYTIVVIDNDPSDILTSERLFKSLSCGATYDVNGYTYRAEFPMALSALMYWNYDEGQYIYRFLGAGYGSESKVLFFNQRFDSYDSNNKVKFQNALFDIETNSNPDEVVVTSMVEGSLQNQVTTATLKINPGLEADPDSAGYDTVIGHYGKMTIPLDEFDYGSQNNN